MRGHQTKRKAPSIFPVLQIRGTTQLSTRTLPRRPHTTGNHGSGAPRVAQPDLARLKNWDTEALFGHPFGHATDALQVSRNVSLPIGRLGTSKESALIKICPVPGAPPKSVLAVPAAPGSPPWNRHIDLAIFRGSLSPTSPSFGSVSSLTSDTATAKWSPVGTCTGSLARSRVVA